MRLRQTGVARRSRVPPYLCARCSPPKLKGRSAEILRGGIKNGVTAQSCHDGFFRTCNPPLPPLEEQPQIVAELDAEASPPEVVRGLLPAFEAKIERILARVWGRSADPFASFLFESKTAI